MSIFSFVFSVSAIFSLIWVLGALPQTSPPGLCPWTPLENFCFRDFICRILATFLIDRHFSSLLLSDIFCFHTVHLELTWLHTSALLINCQPLNVN